MSNVKYKTKTIIMDKSSGANDNITLGTKLSYDASNSAVAVDAINQAFGTNLTVTEFLNFNDIGNVANYIEQQVGG